MILGGSHGKRQWKEDKEAALNSSLGLDMFIFSLA